MCTILLFRGKAATGKTLITNILSKELKTVVIRKDDVYDPLSFYQSEHSIINSASHDIMAKIIQTNVDSDCNLIIDLGLAHTPYIKLFLSKLELRESQIYQFLCTCSNHKEWKRRMENRLINPAPNQFFKSVKEAENHYSKYEIVPMKDETVLDSALDLSINLETIYKEIKARPSNRNN